MKYSLPTPVFVGAIVAVVVVAAFLVFKGATAEPHTPRPDPAMFKKTTQVPTP